MCRLIKNALYRPLPIDAVNEYFIFAFEAPSVEKRKMRVNAVWPDEGDSSGECPKEGSAI